MSGKSLKDKAKALAIEANSGHVLLQKLILDGFFDSPQTSKAAVLRIKEKFGKRWKTTIVQTYMKKFMTADIIHAVKPTGHKDNYWVLTSVTREQALKFIGKTKKVREIEEDLFSPTLMKYLRKDFGRELEELYDNFGKNGNCTAFLLRKILEKLIIIVFGKSGKAKLLEDKTKPGGWIGLKDMIETAARGKTARGPLPDPKNCE